MALTDKRAREVDRETADRERWKERKKRERQWKRVAGRGTDLMSKRGKETESEREQRWQCALSLPHTLSFFLTLPQASS